MINKHLRKSFFSTGSSKSLVTREAPGLVQEIHHENHSLLNIGKNRQQTEVLILGGGVAGRALACALSHSPYFRNEKDDSISSHKKLVLIDDSGFEYDPNFKTDLLK